MALKHLLDLNKTDRYTADGRDELVKLQKEITEDVTYKPGDISQKTGLQKQPDGSWAPPKKGGLGSGTGKKETGNKEQKRQKHIAANAQYQFEAASETANSEIDQANLKSIKSFMDEEHATFKNALYSKAETLARKGARGNPDPENEKSLLKFAEAAGMADDLKLYLKEEVNSKYEFGGAESINRTPERIAKETAIMEALNLSTGEDNNLHKMSDETIERLYEKAQGKPASYEKQKSDAIDRVVNKMVEVSPVLTDPDKARENLKGKNLKELQAMEKRMDEGKAKRQASDLMEKYKDLPGAQKKDALYASTFEGISIGMTQTSMERNGWDLVQADDDVNVYAKPDGSKVIMKHDGKKITSTEYEAPESKPDWADRLDEIGGEIKGNLKAAKYYFDKAQSFSPTDPSYKTYMLKAKEYNDMAKNQADDYGFDFEEMHNSGITTAVNNYDKEQTKPASDAAPRILTGDTKIRVRK